MLMRSLLLALFFLFNVCLAAERPLPYVDADIDPSRSFYLDHVHYPFPHQFARVEDGQGRNWEMAYIDLFEGDAAKKATAPVLILLHGRAMNSGYWGDLLEKPLAAGWRVVSIDWSHTGKSLPRNLDLPVVRSFDDIRTILHNLVVKHLGITKASYLGHSMGGQIAAGYALRYPENVQRLVLYASGGIWSFAPIERDGFRYDDPTLVNRPEDFLAAFKSGKLPSMGATEQQVERSFYTASIPGSLPYLKKGSKLNEFMVASRAGLLRGNPRERERFMQAYAWDSLAAVAECRVEDADALPGRIPRLKMPTFIALGAKDPVVPADSAKSLYLGAHSFRAPIQIKLYDAGHFIHTDLPEQFSREVLDFLTTGKVAEPVYAGIDAPAKKPLAQLPPEVLAFKQRAEAAWAKRDVGEIQRAIYHPDFREDGQSLKERMEFIASFAGMISSWQLVVFDVKREGDILVVDSEIQNTFGNFPGVVRLKELNGVWLSYGNQR
ncbi:MAG: alpha/beta fold hydrolase [Betaproteobacteria bacterium]